MDKEQIVYIELDNWFEGIDYPNIEPIIHWMGNETLGSPLKDEDWVRLNKICVYWYIIDMSFNFMITAPLSFVKRLCPDLLKSEYSEFITFHNENDDIKNTPESRYIHDIYFLPYTKENIGKIKIGDWY